MSTCLRCPDLEPDLCLWFSRGNRRGRGSSSGAGGIAAERISKHARARRDPYKNYHKLTFADLQKRMVRFRWTDYRNAAGLPHVTELNVQHVPFFETLNDQLQTRRLEDWKTYLRWQLLHAKAPFLSKPFVDENFDFFSKTLRGVEQDQPRWKRWKAQTAGQSLTSRDGLTPEQRFFVGNAQWACENTRAEEERMSAMTDPHSPSRYRVNGLVVNMPEFRQAFGSTPGKPLYKEEVCRVW
jgi:predicted metalloendopeptidase